MERNSNKERRLFVGIDPDAERDGVAVLEVIPGQPPRLSLDESTFGRTLQHINEANVYAQAQGIPLQILVEAGWLNRGNFHIRPGDSRQLIAAKGVSQGRNHQRGLDIVEYCRHNRLPVEEVRPLAKRIGGLQLWRGKDGKITQEELEEVTGRTLRVKDKNGRKCRPNQEARDAALIAWNAAGLPVKVKPKK